MGFLDEAGSLINRGVANAGRGTKSISLKAQIGDLNRQRKELMAGLGESLYEEVRADGRYRATREGLFAAVEALDVQRSSVQAELDELERQARLASAPAGSTLCSNCGNMVMPGAAFCTECGTRVTVAPVTAPAEAPARACASCGAPMELDDLFCMRCGTQAAPCAEAPAPEAEAAEAAGEAAPEAEPSAEEPAGTPAPEAEVAAEDSPAAEVAAGEAAAGEDAEPASGSEAEAVSAPAAESGQAGMPVGQQAGLCASCGYGNVPTARFCRNCGNAL